jgi:hypothetical protein
MEIIKVGKVDFEMIQKIIKGVGENVIGISGKYARV